ncbi:MAG: type II secretion system F family protein [Candidatus Scalindua sp.]|jgi:type IV pilus assembly protein PilC|nr:type II secretion system F family protein [Candidatus Scalindua sp.]MBT5304019.1 type II secretion system F family protein [Candidatus Scalindua sp.]MBT6228027.1 type II secretion system F family protein [Candidatus Scalindua sp.]MBT6561917.1 type II secretion system F family protein [Candidatus Scalindua sp.]MBT7211159.1 type II secretion system F family protein [Candidatus Scalindua sp.]
MPTFIIQAIDEKGATVKEKIEALSSEEVLETIRSKGFYPTTIKQVKEKTLKKSTTAKKRKSSLSSISLGKVSDKQINPFTRQLSTLQDADIPIVQSLTILQTQMKKGLLKSAVEEIIADIKGGDTLSIAMSKHPKVFDKLYVNIINAGEISGTLDVILERLATYREKMQKLKRKIISSLMYPATVILASGAILTGIMIFIIPKFAKMFEEMDVALPWLTSALINTSNFLFTHWYVIFGSPVVVFTIFKLVGKIGKFRLIIDKLKFKIPIFGTLINKSVVSKFARTLSTLMSSGVPILEALNNVKDATGNMAMSKAVNQIHDSIREGESIAKPLRESKICDAMVVNMVEIGEQTGELDKMLFKIADNYDNDIDSIAESLTSMMEPFIVVFLGLSVGTIVVALFLPLVKLMNGLGGGM